MPKGKDSKRQRSRRMHDAARAHMAAKVAIPVIAEDDLLAFQTSHFGDDVQPDTFFVSAEEAINWHPEIEQDDGLGWYDDGVKRTLTDDQIAMFRHTELAQLELKRRDESEDLQQHSEVPKEVSRATGNSLEAVSGASNPALEPAATESADVPREATPAPSHRSDSRESSAGAKKRRRKKDIPYNQRHKRKWEKYVEEQDPEQGSMTHNRLLRELDEQKTESVDMDYGDGLTPAATIPSKPSQPSGRRVVSYADD